MYKCTVPYHKVNNTIFSKETQSYAQLITKNSNKDTGPGKYAVCKPSDWKVH